MEVTGSPVLWERMDASISRTQRSSILLVALGTFALLLALFRTWPTRWWAGWPARFPWPGSWGSWAGSGCRSPWPRCSSRGSSSASPWTTPFTSCWPSAAGWRRVAGRREAVGDTLAALGERMIATSVILAGNFLVMAFSDFAPTANFGIFTALTILLALVADLCLVPWALGLTWRRPRSALSTETNTPVRGSL